MYITKACSICKGTLIHEQAVQGMPDGGELVLIDTDCMCTGSDYPGLDFMGTINFPANVLESYVVLEALDATEYNSLTDTQKEGVSMLLSCGKVDMNVGKAGKVRLWNWFGAESTTVANLTALLE